MDILQSNPNFSHPVAPKKVSFAEPLVEKKRVRFAQPISTITFFNKPDIQTDSAPKLTRKPSFRELRTPHHLSTGALNQTGNLNLIGNTGNEALRCSNPPSTAISNSQISHTQIRLQELFTPLAFSSLILDHLEASQKDQHPATFP